MRPELDETLQAPATPSAGSGGSDGSDRTATKGAPAPAARGSGLAAGQQLGHFRIEKQLGAGGMGEVYLATDLALDRPVAIKVLPEQSSRDETRRDRLIREARAQARITHPNVGHIYFIGEQDGRLYFAMEYVAGKTLAERVTAAPMPADEALAVIRAAALGLREAQRNGFTHRDIKPSNLMIDGHGVLKVLDFGLVAGSSAVATGGSVEQTSLAGTPLYMAPEQSRGEAVDFRADIYSLGATLYHLVSGKPPFESESVEQLRSMHASAERPTLPRKGPARTTIGAIEELCNRMMAKEPQKRFASYDDLIEAIELVSSEHTRPAGFWVRSIAMFIDFMIVGILSSILTAALIWKFASDDHDFNLGAVLSPVFVLYVWMLTARFGTTPGKSLLELEVVAVHGGKKPSLWRAAARAFALFGPAILLSFLSHMVAKVSRVGGTIFAALDVAYIVFAVGSLIWASARVPGKRTLWDRISGTMVRYRTTRAPTP